MSVVGGPSGRRRMLWPKPRQDLAVCVSITSGQDHRKGGLDPIEVTPKEFGIEVSIFRAETGELDLHARLVTRRGELAQAQRSTSPLETAVTTLLALTVGR